MKPDAVPFRAKIRRSSPRMRHAMAKHIDQLLADGLIEPSNSAWASPYFLRRKKGGGYRGVVDLRGVNEQTEPDTYPMPNQHDVMDFLAGKCYISALDCRSGFHQIELDDESKDCTTFTCSRGSFRWRVMPMGAKNSSAAFQRCITKILRKFIDVVCVIYIDDILIATKSWKEHVAAMRAIFSALKEAGLALSRDKCTFCLPIMKILGHEISVDGVKPSADKLRALREFPAPRTKRQVQQFVGMVNCYR